jgi:hypothetical protein
MQWLGRQDRLLQLRDIDARFDGLDNWPHPALNSQRHGTGVGKIVLTFR